MSKEINPEVNEGLEPVVVLDKDSLDEDSSGDPAAMAALIQQPAKVLRIGTMIRQLLEEVRAAPLDEAARTRLREIHQQSIVELADGLSPDLIAELERLSLPFTDEAPPSDAELRIAQAQLVGWLEGLFHGIQAAFFAQQAAAKAQFEQMREQSRGVPELGNRSEDRNLGHYL